MPTSGLTLLTGAFSSPSMARIWCDERLVGAMIAVERAWLVGAVSVDGADAAVVAEFDGRAARVMRDWLALRPAMADVGRPVAPLVDALCEGASPALQGCLHLGLTTQDVIDTAMALMVCEAHARLDAMAEKAGRTLADFAAAHGQTAIVARTNGQPAGPITLGRLAADWWAELARGRARVASRAGPAARARFGGAIGLARPFGTRTHAARAAAAEALDLDLADPPELGARDAAADFVQALALLSACSGRVGVSVQAMMAEGLLSETAGGGKSSAMPHKRNPRLAEKLIALASLAGADGAIAIAATQTESVRAGATWMQEWAALERAFHSADAALGTLNALGRAIAVHPGSTLDPRGDDLDPRFVSDRLLSGLSRSLGRGEAARVTAELIARCGTWRDLVQGIEALALAPKARRAVLAECALSAIVAECRDQQRCILGV